MFQRYISALLYHELIRRIIHIVAILFQKAVYTVNMPRIVGRYNNDPVAIRHYTEAVAREVLVRSRHAGGGRHISRTDGDVPGFAALGLRYHGQAHARRYVKEIVEFLRRIQLRRGIVGAQQYGIVALSVPHKIVVAFGDDLSARIDIRLFLLPAAFTRDGSRKRQAEQQTHNFFTILFHTVPH